ncbi:Mak10 subunit, NatC N-terminal acetyltransferase-domain-containing protein [Crassisporium funariophilum]|nr:Mak10 subunit, NatC N-terminal acetyltransferase-domain-containing protein [Crassisporium funariophilum]
MDGLADSALPGGDLDFRDVTRLFEEAAAELGPDNLVFMENFTLQEAMSALEIGEPRLDSGLVVQEQLRPPFNPLTPLLPEELCWILDRSLGYETEFHAGNFLAHTVHTLLYVHHLSDMDPDIIVIPSPPTMPLGLASASTNNHDSSRPIELITIVLRSAVQGLLKCCDLTWRELAKGGAYDTEDWQSDKCEVSLLEGTPVPFIQGKLDGAVAWLAQNPVVPTIWKTALQARLLLRKTLLQIMSAESSKDRREMNTLIEAAREHLHIIQTHPAPGYFELGSPPQLAFDPYIGRRLQMFTPIRVIPPPSFENTCQAIAHLLDGFQEISLLSQKDELVTWEIVGHLRLWLPDRLLRVPYVRSLTQSAFYDGFLILNKHSFGWMINQFFLETIGVDYDSIHAAVLNRWTCSEPAPLKKLERSLYKLITPHMRALWNNPPRKRRHFMKSLVEWHNLYDILMQITHNLDLEDVPRGHLITRLPNVALIWRLSIVREVILSGFQLDLYAPEEKSFAYWYAVQAIEAHLSYLDDLLHLVRDSARVYREMIFQTQFLTALGAMCTALFMVTMPLMSFDWDRMRPNFYRRYKWAFRSEYDDFESSVVAQPELHQFVAICGESLQNGGLVPLESIELARTILSDLVTGNDVGGWAGEWGQDRMQFIQNLLDACNNLRGLPKNSREMDGFDGGLLKWESSINPWFPALLDRTGPIC